MACAHDKVFSFFARGQNFLFMQLFFLLLLPAFILGSAKYRVEPFNGRYFKVRYVEIEEEAKEVSREAAVLLTPPTPIRSNLSRMRKVTVFPLSSIRKREPPSSTAGSSIKRVVVYGRRETNLTREYFENADNGWTHMHLITDNHATVGLSRTLTSRIASRRGSGQLVTNKLKSTSNLAFHTYKPHEGPQQAHQ